MGKLPQITGDQLLNVLLKQGYEVSRQKGSHVQVRKYIDGEKRTFPIPVHKGKNTESGDVEGNIEESRNIHRRIE